jgi:hypothetical protein
VDSSGSNNTPELNRFSIGMMSPPSLRRRAGRPVDGRRCPGTAGFLNRTGKPRRASFNPAAPCEFHLLQLQIIRNKFIFDWKRGGF